MGHARHWRGAQALLQPVLGHQRDHPRTDQRQQAVAGAVEAFAAAQRQGQGAAVAELDDELHLVFEDMVVKVLEVVLALAELVRRHFFQAVQAIADTLLAGLVERVELIQATQVQGHGLGVAFTPRVENFQCPRQPGAG